MLEGKFKQRGISRLSSCEAWLGRHADRKAARKAYLMLARTGFEQLTPGKIDVEPENHPCEKENQSSSKP